MGTKFSTLSEIGEHISPVFSRKRKRDEDDKEPNLKNEQDNLSTPKRKRTKTTSKYIYETLFLEGSGSDVTIHALGKDWNLHKVYLSQCVYFSSMFSGSWCESSLKSITLDIPDNSIDENALKITFSSLYTDNVFIKPVDVAGVLAAANLFQLEGLIQQCVLMMKETVSSLTVCSFYHAAQLYGQEQIQLQCEAWLTENLLRCHTPVLLADISAELMVKLLLSPKLFVGQVEMNIYAMLKLWMFMSLGENKDWTGSLKELEKASAHFYKSVTTPRYPCRFLEMISGQPFIPVFKVVRWEHIIYDISSLKIVEKDRIVPIDWLQPIIQYQWIHMLQVDQGFDQGPPQDLSDEVFDDMCVRCGRVLDKNGQYFWRWTGFSFGFDLILSYSNRIICLKRNTRKENCPNAVCLLDERSFLFGLTVTSIDELGRVKHSQTTGIKHLTLAPDEEKMVLLCDHQTKFPLHVNLNLLFITPMANNVKPELKVNNPVTNIDSGIMPVYSTNSNQLSNMASPGSPLSKKEVLGFNHQKPVITMTRETQTPFTETLLYSAMATRELDTRRRQVNRKINYSASSSQIDSQNTQFNMERSYVERNVGVARSTVRKDLRDVVRLRGNVGFEANNFNVDETDTIDVENDNVDVESDTADAETDNIDAETDNIDVDTDNIDVDTVPDDVETGAVGARDYVEPGNTDSEGSKHNDNVVTDDGIVKLTHNLRHNGGSALTRKELLS